MMDADSNKALDHSLDNLEIAFSDSARKLVRRIRTEWQGVVKYKNDVSAKESELITAKEKVMHLNETRIQNERYLDTTQRRLENLKLSNIQLKNKLNYLKKEEERVTKNWSEKQEYIHSKIMTYKEKWRKRYESHYSKIPRVLEKQRSLKEMEELRKKLCVLSEEYQKCEKELFRAKCEQNRRNAESTFYPFNSFVVSVAKIYIDTKNVFHKCEVVSKEISFIENKVNQLKSKQQILIQSKEPLNSKNSECYVNAEPNAIEEINNGPTLNKMDISDQRQENLQNVNSNRILNQINISDGTCKNSNALYMDKNLTVKNVVIQKETKVRKWMERLKIVSKFAITPEETDKQEENYGRSNAIGILKTKEKRAERSMESAPAKLSNVHVVKRTKESEVPQIMETLPLISNTESSTDTSNRDILAPPPIGNVDTNTGRFMSRNFVGQPVSINTTSKYFRKNNSDISMTGWNNMLSSNEEIKGVKSFVQDGVRQTNLENLMVMNVNENIPENKNDLQQKTSRFGDEMDIDEGSKAIRSCSFNEIHNNIQDKNIEENLQEGIDSVLLGSKDEVETRKLLSKENEVNAKSSLLNNNSDEGEYLIQLDKMNVNELATQLQDDAQNSTDKNFTDNSIVSEKKPYQEEQNPQQSSRSHSLYLQPISMNTESDSNKNSTENIRNDVNTNAAKALKEPNINASFPETPLIATDKISKSHESTPQTSSRESNPSLTKQTQNSAEESASTDNSNFASFKPGAISPGFGFTTRPMYSTNAPSCSKEPPSANLKDSQANMFASMAFFNNALRNNINFAPVQSPEEDKTEFLASVYEDYLTDSPPLIKGTEKSMFVLSENSPGKEDEDFFPLFAGDNGQSSKDTKDGGAQFMFNFSSNSKTQSPDDGTGFKFLF